MSMLLSLYCHQYPPIISLSLSKCLMFLSKKPSAKPIHARNGFLLFELTTALAIIAFLCALGIPCLRCLDKAHIRGEVEKLSSQIQYSQGLAIATGKTQEVPLVSHDPTVKI